MNTLIVVLLVIITILVISLLIFSGKLSAMKSIIANKDSEIECVESQLGVTRSRLFQSNENYMRETSNLGIRNTSLLSELSNANEQILKLKTEIINLENVIHERNSEVINLQESLNLWVNESKLCKERITILEGRLIDAGLNIEVKINTK